MVRVIGDGKRLVRVIRNGYELVRVGCRAAGVVEGTVSGAGSGFTSKRAPKQYAGGSEFFRAGEAHGREDVLAGLRFHEEPQSVENVNPCFICAGRGFELTRCSILHAWKLGTPKHGFH